MNVVVTGGGTIAPIDDVRHITNASSGRFSAAITEACLARGATVWHVHTPTALLPYWRSAGFNLDAPDPEAEWERLAELRRRWLDVHERLHLVPITDGTVGTYAMRLHDVLTAHRIDVAFLAMAVSDFEPVQRPGKLDSSAFRSRPVLRLHPTPKVIQRVKDWAPGVFLVGFKLLSGASEAALVEAAELSGRRNRADLTVANDLSTLRDGRHTVHLVRPGAPAETLPPGPDLAERLVDRVFALRAAGAGG
jgi:phosphopantothenoylcysteine synthetase/decarboxylase